MKKILNISLILLFVSTLFIGCPPRVPNPPINPNDTISDTISDTITHTTDKYKLDYIYNYVSKEYLLNYIPYEIGTAFTFVNDSNMYDTLYVTLDDIYYVLDSFYNPNKNIFSKQYEQCGGESLVFAFTYNTEEFKFVFTTMIQLGAYVSNTFALTTYDFTIKRDFEFDTTLEDCNCYTKDCFADNCLNEEIILHKDDELKCKVEQGKGITLFKDDKGNYWHLVE